jgi:hypothetical protein
MSKIEAVKTFSFGLSSVKRYVASYREERSLAPKKRPGSKPKLDEGVRGLLEADLQEHPATTLPQRREFLRVCAAEVSDSTSVGFWDAWGGGEKEIASIATMVLATSRLAGLTRTKEGFVPFQRSVDRLGGRRGTAGRRQA